MIFVVYKEKNMKKSKIIVPAIAMIAFSTAASIAGSVAWFTASRQVDINAGSYTVVKTTTNLTTKLTGGIGTSASGNVVSVPTTTLLTDASFNYDTQKIFAPNADGTAIDDEKTVNLSEATPSNLKREELTTGETVFSAVTWDIEFTLGFGATAGNYGLYLDEAHSSFVGTGSDNYTAKGFRIALVPNDPTGYTMPSGSARTKTVYAGLQTFAKSSYVADKNNFTGTAYDADANVLVYQGYATGNALPDDGTAASTATDRADYMGTFGFIASTSVKLCYKAVCWFEGTDENVVNQDDPTKYQSVQANLRFVAIKLGA